MKYFIISRLRPYFSLLSLMFFPIPLLEFVLVCWCPDVVSMSRVAQFLAISGADVVSFAAQNVSFGDPVRPLWCLGGSSSDPGALGSIRKETLGSRLGSGFLLILNDFGTAFLEVLANFGATCVFFPCLFPCHVCQCLFLSFACFGFLVPRRQA